MDFMLRNTATQDAFVKKGTKILADHMRASIDKYGHTIVGLSGGSTPKPIYEALAKEEIDWKNVSLFLTDDRYVSANHKDSNQKLVIDSLLEYVFIPEDQIIFPDTSLPLDACIADYEVRLATLLAKGIPHIITLGMGDDGHIASLFPPLPDAAFGDHLVLNTETEKFAVRERISTTMVVLLSASVKLFFLRGEEKKKVWEEMQEAEFDPFRWPAQAVLKIGGAEVITVW